MFRVVTFENFSGFELLIASLALKPTGVAMGLIEVTGKTFQVLERLFAYCAYKRTMYRMHRQVALETLQGGKRPFALVAFEECASFHL